jgi:hypothetical protein
MPLIVQLALERKPTHSASLDNNTLPISHFRSPCSSRMLCLVGTAPSPTAQVYDRPRLGRGRRVITGRSYGDQREMREKLGDMPGRARLLILSGPSGAAQVSGPRHQRAKVGDDVEDGRRLDALGITTNCKGYRRRWCAP